MENLLKKINNLNLPILITGPSGTGKSLFAETIFNNSNIFKEKYLTLHLASIKEDLIESELFGHVKGSFTGAVDNKNGYFKNVESGTLFLDEIGELSLESQKKLLYLLEEKKFTPVGSTRAIDFLGRIIMATNKNLKQLVEQGKFREDLYYRLNVINIELKNIANDKTKLKKEIKNLFKLTKIKYQKENMELSFELEEQMCEYNWPGNYRELKNFFEYVVNMSENKILEVSDAPTWFSPNLSQINNKSTEDSNFLDLPNDYNKALEIFEKHYIGKMLFLNKGKVNETARVLGISKTTLISKAKKYSISSLKMRSDFELLKAA